MQQVRTPPHSNLRSKAQHADLKRAAPIPIPTYTHPTPLQHSNHYVYTESQRTRPNDAPSRISSHPTPSHHELPPTSSGPKS